MPVLICPNDETPMKEMERHGVHIDMCPTCRGVWLDRGELEKLLEFTGGRDAGARGYEDDSYRRESYKGHKPHKKKRRDLFDFFDF